jgi:hypothetical protein
LSLLLAKEMKKLFKHIVLVAMMLFILFSTIGINIISTLCIGCETEHTAIAISAPETTGCACCADSGSDLCCSNDVHSEKEQHTTTSVFAKLKILLADQKNKSVKIIMPEIVLFIYASFIVFDSAIQDLNLFEIGSHAPPLSGRLILALNCILRN